MPLDINMKNFQGKRPSPALGLEMDHDEPISRFPMVPATSGTTISSIHTRTYISTTAGSQLDDAGFTDGAWNLYDFAQLVEPTFKIALLALCNRSEKPSNARLTNKRLLEVSTPLEQDPKLEFIPV